MNEKFIEFNESSRTNEIPETDPIGTGPPSAEDETNHEPYNKPEPLIYVADLAAYNNGTLHGVWLDAAREPRAIYDDIHRMLNASPENILGISVAEEFAIHDYEQFGNCTIHEFDSIELVSKIARGIHEHGYAFAAWADVQEGNPELLDHFTKAYVGHYDSLDAFVVAGLEERDAETELSRAIQSSPLSDLGEYITIDVEAIARDLSMSGDLYVYKAPLEIGGVWVFDERA